MAGTWLRVYGFRLGYRVGAWGSGFRVEESGCWNTAGSLSPLFHSLYDAARMQDGFVWPLAHSPMKLLRLR